MMNDFGGAAMSQALNNMTTGMANQNIAYQNGYNVGVQDMKAAMAKLQQAYNNAVADKKNMEVSYHKSLANVESLLYQGKARSDALLQVKGKAWYEGFREKVSKNSDTVYTNYLRKKGYNIKSIER
jgi:hypothetical protein